MSTSAEWRGTRVGMYLTFLKREWGTQGVKGAGTGCGMPYEILVLTAVFVVEFSTAAVFYDRIEQVKAGVYAKKPIGTTWEAATGTSRCTPRHLSPCDTAFLCRRLPT